MTDENRWRPGGEVDRSQKSFSGVFSAGDGGSGLLLVVEDVCHGDLGTGSLFASVCGFVEFGAL